MTMRRGINRLLITGIVFCLFLWSAIASLLLADELKCPNPVEACRVLYLSVQEERALTQPNGVLDTAAQARALELGQFVVYFKTRISGSQLIEAPAKKDEHIPGTAPKPVDSPK